MPRRTRPRTLNEPSETGTIATRLGTRPLRGRNRWRMPLVMCPNCGGTATVDARGDIWCWACNYTTSAQSGCT